MGSMSASDAAPLPRLGEVFFDVRGESRSMRLSWYADTGVAVFSIWQGGTCTGTFRLPIADLPRMVEALQRGPRGQDDPVAGERLASREPRLPAAPGPPSRPGPARSSQPELLDSDIKTGQTTAAIYLPPVESDLRGYPAEPPLPDYGPPPGGPDDYQASAPPQPGYRGRAPRRRRGPPAAPERAAEAAHGHSGEDLAGPGGYAAEPPPPDFTGQYQAPPAAGYPGEALEGYRGEPGTAGYPGEPTAGYPGEPADGYLGEGTAAPDYPGDYQDGPPGIEPGGLRGGPPADDYPGGYRGEGRSGRYPASRAGQPGRTSRARRGGRGSGPADEASGDYLAAPPSGGYPDEQDYQPYPEELAATEYGSPARPYAAGTRDTDEPVPDDQPERRKPRSRRRAEPSPDSFPYGPPPTADEPRPRGRYPGRH
jgi:hypothetical protein